MNIVLVKKFRKRGVIKIRINKLIKKLEEMRDKYGDIKVATPFVIGYVGGNDFLTEVGDVIVLEDHNNDPHYGTCINKNYKDKLLVML